MRRGAQHTSALQPLRLRPAGSERAPSGVRARPPRGIARPARQPGAICGAAKAPDAPPTTPEVLSSLSGARARAGDLGGRGQRGRLPRPGAVDSAALRR